MLENNNTNSSLSKLRSILNENEQIEIEKLKEKIKLLEKEVASDGKVQTFFNNQIEDALVNPDNQLRNTIHGLVPDSLKSVMKNKPETIVDTLYPVIGDIVGKYVTESLKDFMDSINDKIENQLPYQRVLRSMKAKIKGVSEEEYIFLEAQKARVNGILLIEKGSGIIIDSYLENDFKTLNPDLFAGMLMALQSFGKDCLDDKTEGSLDQIEYGGSKILIESAGSVLLAVLVKGDISKDLLKSVRLVLSNIILEHRDSIQQFNGDSSSLPPTLQSSLKGLVSQGSQEDLDLTEQKSYKWLGLACIVCLIAGSFYISYRRDKVLAKIKKHLVYKELNLKLRTRLFTFMSLEGTASSQQQKEEIQQYLNSETKEKLLYENINVDKTQTTPFIEKTNGLINWSSTIFGLSLNIKAKKIITITGNADSIQTKEMVINKVNQMFPLQKPVINLNVNPELFHTVIFFKNGKTLINDNQKAQIKKFYEQKLNGISYFNITGFSNSLGSISTKVTLSSKRNLHLQQVLTDLGVSKSRIKTKLSLNYDGALLDQKTLNYISNQKESFILLEKNLSLKN